MSGINLTSRRPKSTIIMGGVRESVAGAVSVSANTTPASTPPTATTNPIARPNSNSSSISPASSSPLQNALSTNTTTATTSTTQPAHTTTLTPSSSASSSSISPSSTAPNSTCTSTTNSNNSTYTLPAITHLSASALSPTINLEGYLLKQDGQGLIKGYKKRWFSANNMDYKMMYYKPSFNSRDYDQIAGQIDLHEATELRPGSQKLSFEIVTHSRIWVLLASSEEDYQYWTNGLRVMLNKSKSSIESTPDSSQILSNRTSLESVSLTKSTDSLSKPDLMKSNDSLWVQEKSTKKGNKSDKADKDKDKADKDILNVDEKEKPTAIYEGYLQKQGEKGLVKSWKKRYFVAKGTRLWYYKQGLSSSNYDQRVGFIDLSTVSKIEQPSTNKASFIIHTSTRVWNLQAANEEEKNLWINGLATLLAAFSSKPTNIEAIRQSIMKTDKFLPNDKQSVAGPSKEEFDKLQSRVLELEKLMQAKDKVIENLKDKCTKMEDKMILWNRIAFLNWSEATELDKKMAEAEKARETTAEDEPYLKQIRLLKKQLNEKTFNCQVLENEVERLQAELRKQSSASTSSSSTLTPTPTPTLPPTTNSATPNTEVEPTTKPSNE